jgi:hypothetical protein
MPVLVKRGIFASLTRLDQEMHIYSTAGRCCLEERFVTGASVARATVGHRIRTPSNRAL